MALVTYQAAVDHLRQNGVLNVSPEDPDLARKVEQASAMVITYLKRPAEWDINSLPEDDQEFAWVQAAVNAGVCWLYQFRGDTEIRMSFYDLMERMGGSMYRDPSMA